MATRKVSWSRELADLVATARTEKEKAAVKAFAKAMRPYLSNPAMLRTLLGKIQASIPEGDVGVVVTRGEFKSLNDVKKALPKGVKMVKL
jgi:hypothetical protein